MSLFKALKKEPKKVFFLRKVQKEHFKKDSKKNFEKSAENRAKKSAKKSSVPF